MIITTMIQALALSWLRLFIGIVISLLLSIPLGIFAGISRTAERIIIPLIDILQSIPILGFFPIAVLFFVAYIPIVGVELAAIFLIVTSQIWNLIFAVYESVKSIPSYILEEMEISKLSPFQRLTKVYIPSSWPRIIDNLPLSWAGGLFFLSSSEIISVGTTSYTLLGVGSLTFELFNEGNYHDIGVLLLLLFIALAATHFLFFRPLSNWSQKFKYETVAETSIKTPWFISSFFRTTKPLRILANRVFIPRRPISNVLRNQYIESEIPITLRENRRLTRITQFSNFIKFIKWIIIIALIFAISYGLFFSRYFLYDIFAYYIDPNILQLLLISTAYSAMRIGISVALMFPIIIISILAVTNATIKKYLLPLLLFLASFPAPLAIPFLYAIFGGNIEVISIIVIILGSIWYIFYNTYSSLQLLPTELKECIKLCKLSKFQKFIKFYFPSMLPGLVTGLVTAVGGAWNALIVAEWIQVGNNIYSVGFGLGKLLDATSSSNDLGLFYASLLFMVIIIVILDRFFWKKLYDYTTSKFKYE